jgi:hypothetical protein
MVVILAGSLVTLGLPFLQAPWWLAVSLASYTLAGALWGLLLPLLRPGIGPFITAKQHLFIRKDRGLPDALQLAHWRAQEAHLTRLVAATEGILIAVLTPVLGVLVDLYGNVDRILILVGLCFLLALTLSALTTVLKSLKHDQRSAFGQIARSRFGRRAAHTWKPVYSPVRLVW